MLSLLVNRLRNKSDVQETSWEKRVDNTVYKRRTPKCGIIICVAVVATLFFAIGCFQTFLAIFYVRESSKRPILVMGPMFAGVGIVLYVALVEMCLIKWRKRKKVSSGELPVSDALAEEDKPAYADKPRTLSLQLQTYKLPAILTLTKEDIMRMGPEQKQQLLGGPLLMPPIADKSCTVVPLNLSGVSTSPKVPDIATYNPPPEAANEGNETNENQTDQAMAEEPEPMEPVKLEAETAVEVLNTGSGFVEESEQEEECEEDSAITRESKSTMTDLTPSRRHSKIPEEIFQMLGKVEEVYRTADETPSDPSAVE